MVNQWSNAQWTITTNKGTILDATGMDSAENRLKIPVPEMIFGSSEITIAHSSGWTLSFKALDALDLVDKTGEKSNLQVAYSEEWRKSRQNNSHGHDVSKIHRPFDWTYSTTYQGTENKPRLKTDNNATLPIDRLKAIKPILLYDEVLLYEDELGDNGLVNYTGKIRVMESELLILVRMYLRVDGVVFRTRDTRVFVDFEKDEVIRNYQEKEALFEKVKKKAAMTSIDFTQLLRDPNWIDTVLPVVKSETSRCEL